MKIGILGAGNIGGTLGSRWAAEGQHKVVYGARDPNSAKTRAALAESGPDARAVSLVDAAAFGEVLVIALPADAVAGALAQMGDLNGKIVIDATNDVRHARPADSPSMSNAIARQLPGARVVKCFNTMTWETIRDPKFNEGVAATAFLCGDDASAKAVVSGLAAELGLDSADLGPLAQAAMQDGLLLVFFALAQTYGRDIALKMLRR